MRIENPNCSKPRRNQNRSRSNLGGKKEQMKKITPVSLICLLFILATVLTLPMISGCARAAKVAATPLPSALSVGTPSPNRGRFDLPPSGDEVWIVARNNKPLGAPWNEGPGSGALMARIE